MATWIGNEGSPAGITSVDQSWAPSRTSVDILARSASAVDRGLIGADDDSIRGEVRYLLDEIRCAVDQNLESARPAALRLVGLLTSPAVAGPVQLDRRLALGQKQNIEPYRGYRAVTVADGQKACFAMDLKPTVFVVDNDISVRESLELLIADAGWRPELFASAQEFLTRARPAGPSCLILDVHLPDLNGLEVQRLITTSHRDLPIIFITGHGDILTTVQAMKAGAVEVLTKPISADVFLTATQIAFERSRAALANAAILQALRDRHSSLTRREQEVMALVVRGQLNKQVGGALGISEITVKAHRGRVMRKMRAKSLLELVNLADLLGVETAGKSSWDSQLGGHKPRC